MYSLQFGVFFLVFISFLTASSSQGDALQHVNQNEIKWETKEIATKNPSPSYMTGRFLDVLLKPLKKAWRVFIMRTLLPSLMGAKLIVLLPTLVVVVLLLEGALITAGFFYLLFTSAVAGKSDHLEIEPPFPWHTLDSLLNEHFDQKSKDISTPVPPLANILGEPPTGPTAAGDIIIMSPTAADNSGEATWNHHPYYYTSNISNDVAEEVNQFIYQGTSNSNPFSTYYASHHTPVSGPQYIGSTVETIPSNVYL